MRLVKLLGLLFCQLAFPTWAAITDIANAPLFTSAGSNVKSNVMFVLDDSGSMDWDYLPDDVPRSDKYGYYASQCNGVAFNPDIAYKPPVKADGSAYPAANFLTAKSDGFSGTGSVNLTNRFYYVYSGAQAPMSYTYTSSGLTTNTTFYKECASSIGSLPGSAVFTKVTVNSTAANAQNYANWYSYYRTRMLMMKSSVGLAFQSIDARYRIGFRTIHDRTASGADFLDIADFDATQKSLFYSKLYGVSPNGMTPLRGALATTGQYFARKMSGQSVDPVQYACQKNFTILSTDGYWNTGDESSSYGPFQLNNSSKVGQQDGIGTPRPLFDGETSRTTTSRGRTTTSVSGGSSDSLADVAMYYYQTDLRTSALGNCTGALGADVCVNNVAGNTRDSATWQHMTTFTLGLGASGVLNFDVNYLTQNSGDYFDIRQGTRNWPLPDGGAANIDDLWHAAVDGRGKYFSAKDPAGLATGLNDALDAIKTITGSASAAATSSLQPVQGDNDIFVALFTSAKWTGDVLSYKIDPASGVIATTPTWSAQLQLDQLPASSRHIYFANADNALTEFNDANLTAYGRQGDFAGFCNKTGVSGVGAPQQCATLNPTDLASANQSSNLVGYLRGNAYPMLYRTREHVLGDVINAAPLFVGRPNFKYVENSYQVFANSSPAATRRGMVYVAANDGMLHAVDRASGIEQWAYVPRLVMPRLYRLADNDYAANHQFYVDGSPVMGDVFVNGHWKTILIGGLNSGGRGYYALDVTDPDHPVFLWEFSSDNLGLSYGNPIITKKKEGTWVVLFGSGYNNVTPGDGNGHLFMLDAYRGTHLLELPTFNAAGVPVGSTGTPSGLAKINVYVATDLDNTTEVVYAGDLLGNVWRFDINSTVKPYLSAMRLAQLSANGMAQPITTAPVLAEVNYLGSKFKVLYIGTGKYLGLADLTDTQTQTVYALKDPWSESGLGNVRSALDANGQVALVAQSASLLAAATPIIQVTSNPVNWDIKTGWYLDLIGNGERVNVSPHLVLNTLFVGTNTPQADACTVGGTSWLYKLDIGTGSALSNASGHAAATSLGNVLVMGLTTVVTGTGSGSGNLTTIVTRSDGSLSTVNGAQAPVRNALRRTSWRVLK